MPTFGYSLRELSYAYKDQTHSLSLHRQVDRQLQTYTGRQIDKPQTQTRKLMDRQQPYARRQKGRHRVR